MTRFTRTRLFYELLVTVALVSALIIVFKVLIPHGKTYVRSPPEKLFAVDANRNPIEVIR